MVNFLWTQVISPSVVPDSAATPQGLAQSLTRTYLVLVFRDDELDEVLLELNEDVDAGTNEALEVVDEEVIAGTVDARDTLLLEPPF